MFAAPSHDMATFEDDGISKMGQVDVDGNGLEAWKGKCFKMAWSDKNAEANAVFIELGNESGGAGGVLVEAAVSAASRGRTEDVSGGTSDGDKDTGRFFALAERRESLRRGPGTISSVGVDGNKADDRVVKRCASSKVALVTGALRQKLVSYYAACRGAYKERERSEFCNL